MAARLSMQTDTASSFEELIPILIDTLQQATSKAASSSSSIPDFSIAQNSIKASLHDFACTHKDRLASESGAKEALGLEIKKFLTDRLVEDLGSRPIEDVLPMVYACCDIAILSFQEDLVDSQLPFILIEQTADMLPISACSSLWSYAELRRAYLTADLTPGRGTALGILRTSNELLRRISKSNIADASLGGRVLGFVSEMFPLDDKGGRNQMGLYNTSNVTKTEAARPKRRKEDSGAEAQDGEEDDEEDEEDLKDDIFPPNFYDDFWALQRFFSNPRALLEPYTPPSSSRTAPPSTADGAEPSSDQQQQQPQAPPTEPTSLKYFYEITRVVIDVFKKIQDQETERAYASRSTTAAAQPGKEGSSTTTDDLDAQMVSATEVKVEGSTSFAHLQPIPLPSSSNRLKRKLEGQEGTGVKRTRTAWDIGVDRQGSKAGAGGEDGEKEEEELFFPKFLTGRKLLKYELRDPGFRFHVLLQYFILLQFVLSWASDEKWTPDKVKVAALARPHQLSNDDNQLLRRAFWPQISNLARALYPRLAVEPTGATFVDAKNLRQDGQVPVLLATDTTTSQTVRGHDILKTANQILRREQHWISWKMKGCEPPIERSWASNASGTEEEEKKALNEARNKISATLKRNPAGPISSPWEHSLGTPALTRLWERGFPPPTEGTRMKENEEGIEELCRTDGMEILEGTMRDMPTVEEVGERVALADERVEMRKGEVREELIGRKRGEWREKVEKKKEEEAKKNVEDGEAEEEKVAVDGDVEMKDADVENKDVDAESKPNGTVSTEMPKPAEQEEVEPKFTITDDELNRALETDEEYGYLEESRLNASWKYLRLARGSTVAHWTNLTPGTVVEVIRKVKKAEEVALARSLRSGGTGMGMRAGSEAVRSGEGTPAPAVVLGGEEEVVEVEVEKKKDGEGEEKDGEGAGKEGGEGQVVNGAVAASSS
ncbi:hypothetical protein CF327_g2075 [Tilletia walkeri]|nr:hypothetical protein CF327_g2075 [Tilletia walkeri]